MISSRPQWRTVQDILLAVRDRDRLALCHLSASQSIHILLTISNVYWFQISGSFSLMSSHFSLDCSEHNSFLISISGKVIFSITVT